MPLYRRRLISWKHESKRKKEKKSNIWVFSGRRNLQRFLPYAVSMSLAPTLPPVDQRRPNGEVPGERRALRIGGA